METKIGDEMRRAGEFEMVVCEDDKNPLFTIQNSGKRLTSIDLKNPDGKAAFLKLLETADVFLTNVRLPSLGRLGLDYETLHKAYPGLVYAHFSGFGPKGPDAAKPGFDSTAFWLRSGPMADWQVPGSFPFTPTYAFGDMATSSAFLSGILMALIGKKSTGMGTFVSTSLFASGIWCNAIGVVSHQPQFGGERPNDPLRPADPFCHFYECSDGKWIGVFDNEYRRETCSACRRSPTIPAPPASRRCTRPTSSSRSLRGSTPFSRPRRSPNGKPSSRKTTSPASACAPSAT